MMNEFDEEERIGPINGHNNSGPDIIANGCLWIVGIFFIMIIVFGSYGFYMDGWK